MELASEFDLGKAASIEGRVTWAGAIPVVPPYQCRPHPLAGLGLRERQMRENPNAPQIDPASHGVANAVVHLRGIDRKRSKPWDLPPVRVEMRERRLAVCQGERQAHVGIVRRGDAVTMVSHDRFFHSLHADGAAYFSLMFPDPDQPLERKLNSAGLVEWSSGCGYYWLRGYTFVDDHPYYAVTDAQGYFRLEHVPPGEYDMVCWLPNWLEARHDLDPDMAIIWRLSYRPPIETVQHICVTESAKHTVGFVLSATEVK